MRHQAKLGDAGHYIDPITGQGINDALRSAELFAQAWARTRRLASWSSAMARYQRRREAATRPMYTLLALSARLQLVAEAGLDLDTPLMQAIARQPEVASRYIGIYSDAAPVGARGRRRLRTKRTAMRRSVVIISGIKERRDAVAHILRAIPLINALEPRARLALSPAPMLGMLLLALGLALGSAAAVAWRPTHVRSLEVLRSAE
jgi:hypothetical protein